MTPARNHVRFVTVESVAKTARHHPEETPEVLQRSARIQSTESDLGHRRVGRIELARPTFEATSVGSQSLGDIAKMTSRSSGVGARKTPTRKTSSKKKKVSKKPPAHKRATKRKAATKSKGATKKRATAKETPAPKQVAKKTPVRRQVAQKTATHSLTPQAKGGGAERRTDERYDVHGLLEVDIELFGYQRDGRPFGIGRAPNAPEKIHSVGHTVNLSVSGLLAHVTEMVADGSNCLVRFVTIGDSVRPQLRWGVVVRCSELDSGKYEIAMRFDSPLDHLDVKALDAA